MMITLNTKYGKVRIYEVKIELGKCNLTSVSSVYREYPHNIYTSMDAPKCIYDLEKIIEELKGEGYCLVDLGMNRDDILDLERTLSHSNNSLSDHQPDPVPNDNPAVWDLVVSDMKERDSVGEKRYGTRLQPFNGRDALIDSYQEALDLVVYLRQLIYERDGK